MTRREWLLAMTGAMCAREVLRAQRDRAAAQELSALSLTDLVAGVVRREVSPLDLVEAYLSRIQMLNPELNAFVTVAAEQARPAAWRASRAMPPPPYDPREFPAPLLLGAPIAHKDLFETAGLRTTAGSRLYDGYLPARDAFVVSQLAQAGAVTLGKTNTHELGGGVTTINPFYGTTRNPVDRARIPGGSSGGSAAAVVARLCVAATGSDTGGSVRIPAALCGCVGFKPSVDRISTAGLLGSCPTFDHVGFLTRTVADAELMFAAAIGNPKGLPPQMTVKSSQAARSKDSSGGNPLGLPESNGDKPLGLSRPDFSGDKPLGLSIKIGVPRAFFFDRLQPDVARAIESAIERFRAMGASVDDFDFPIDATTMARVFDPIVVSEIWARLGERWRARPDAFSPAFATVFQNPPPSRAAVEASRRALRDFRLEIDRRLGQTPILLLPTVPITAPLIDGPIDGMLILRNTWPFNAAGTPAISVPCGVDGAGLPIGLQLVARRQQDQLLLNVARAFEAHSRGSL